MNKDAGTKIAVIVLIAAVLALFRALDLQQYLSLSYLKASQERFAALYADNRLAVLAAYFALYVLVAGLSLPGAAVMTVAGGALFGFRTGLITVSFASTIGATLACAVSRFLLRDWVQGRFGDKLAAVHRGIEQEGAFYLFSLRLIPLFPFFAINLVMGLTRMPLLRFAWVSQIGMLSGTAVFVNAGNELSRIESLSGILSPRLLASFALLGLFPLIAKRTVGLYRSRRVRPDGQGPTS